MSERGDAFPSDADLDELLASVTALRGELDRRLLRRGRHTAPSRPEPRAEPQPEEPSLLDRLGALDPVRLLADLRARVPLPGPSDVSDEVDPFGLDERYLKASRPLLDFLFDRWWRIETAGIDAVPDVPRVIFVANRSGILPYDALMLAHAVERQHRSHRRPRFLIADFLMGKPFVRAPIERLGGTRACTENAERLLDSDQWIISFPEGQRGALKPFDDRYRLQRFGRGGFVSLALRRRAVVVPVAIVGGEEVHPILARPRLAERWLGTSFPVTPTFPLLGPMGLIPLPSKWRIRFGEALRLDTADPERADDDLFVSQTREQVRASIQSALEEELGQRFSMWS
jgi:1-acyl-sn-glycerol-3-phosphate acyltransferase